MHADTIVAYTYQANIFCPDCIIDWLPTGEGGAFDGWKLAEGATPMTTEANLSEIAHAFGINRDDERTFDSGYFPKVVFADMIEDDCEVCSNCEETLMGYKRVSLSSGHFSVDGQLEDAVNWLEDAMPDVFADFLVAFPEWRKRTMGQYSSWFDTEAMGVDPEWASWAIDWLESNTMIQWEDGEPWVRVDA